MSKPDRAELERKARKEFERLLPSMIDKLAEFVDDPKARTLLESEKGLNAILGKMGDGIMADAFKDTAESQETTEAAVESAKKNTGRTTPEEKPRSSSSTEKP